MTVFPIDPVVALRRIALEAAAERLGITLPVGRCTRCGCSLYPEDLHCDALPCEDGCPAKQQLEAIYP